MAAVMDEQAALATGVLHVLELLHPAGQEISLALHSAVPVSKLLSLYPVEFESLPQWFSDFFRDQAELLVFAYCLGAKGKTSTFTPPYYLTDENYERLHMTTQPLLIEAHGLQLRMVLATLFDESGFDSKQEKFVAEQLINAADLLWCATHFTKLPELKNYVAELRAELEHFTKALREVQRVRAALADQRSKSVLTVGPARG